MTLTGELGPQDPRRTLDDDTVRTVWVIPDEIRASRGRRHSPLLLVCIEGYLAGERCPFGALYTHASVYGLGAQL